jgi:hypothetical protein
MTLVEMMQKAELATTLKPWPDTPYRTIRRLDNREAAERAVAAVEEHFAPLMAAINHIFRAETWADGTLIAVDEEEMQAALDELGRAYDQCVLGR